MKKEKLDTSAPFYGNALFVEDIDWQDVNQLLSLVTGLTYRKLCILSLAGRKTLKGEPELMKDPFSWYPAINLDIKTSGILNDILELTALNFVDFQEILLGWKSIRGNNLMLTSLGQKYFELLSLDEIEAKDYEDVVIALSYKKEYGDSFQNTSNGIHLNF
ncbi:hypothetical protein GS399_00880 [Pedobacter sp. HMF7647]|uniref:Uncharacterized protein n=1 Tax=Hufsiella arboris TaxID=2695275 RepID=A0A7K1Y523_9SPHI|nr:hypothetical protein [Hufsiella arboris]MXV49510.1 hypothetical protein [Hufsiella arboris]